MTAFSEGPANGERSRNGHTAANVHLGLALEKVLRLTRMDTASLLLPEGFQVVAGRGAGSPVPGAEVELMARGECPCGRAAKGEAVLSRDVTTDPGATLQACRQSGLRGRLCLPLARGDGHSGLVTLGSRHPLEDGPTLEDARCLAGLLSLLVESLLREAEASELAVTDPLTGLPNRRLWPELEREAALAQRRHRPFALMLLDVDGLKSVNDRFGHQAGDELLRQFGRILRAGARSSDLACRYGGDEFVLMLPETERSGALAMAGRIRELVASWDWKAAGVPVIPDFGMGVASYPEDGSSVDDLLRQADLAMLRAEAARTKGARERQET